MINKENRKSSPAKMKGKTVIQGAVKTKAMVSMDDCTMEYSRQVSRKSIKKAVRKNMSILKNVSFG